MQLKHGWIAAASFGLLFSVALSAQNAPAPAPAPAPAVGGGQAPPNFPQQQRGPGDPVLVARGKGLYDVNCSSCHGADLRGGDMGGPNLLRSQVALNDKAGELFIPIVHGSRQAMGMPAVNIPDDATKAIAEYVHSVLSLAGRQGRPPVAENVPASAALVGDPAAGQTYFAGKCSSCHQATGDLKGIGARLTDPRQLQNFWVSGGGGAITGGRGGGGGRARNPITATITAGNQKVDGRLVRIDDFNVTIVRDDGTRQTFERNGDVPKIDVHDPMEPHRKLVTTLDDKDMHDVTAYLASLK